MSDLIRLDFVVSEEDVDGMTGVLARMAAFGWEEASLPTGETRFTLHCDNASVVDDICAEAALRVPAAVSTRTAVPNRDWQAAWKEFFTPVTCGRFTVLPPWRVPELLAGSTPIVIEPKSAFGTGHHNTTVLCLQAIADLLDAGRLRAGMRFFDLGTGTGILGIGCALSGLTGMGSDIDPLAVDNAKENAVINNVPRFDVRAGGTEAAEGERFDLVVANILAGPLKELAPDIMRLLKPSAVLVLSGILTVQAEGVAQVYAALGKPTFRTSGDWSALVWM